MHGMLFAMSMAMGIGLFVGTVVGILIQDNLIVSTIVGIGAGSFAGILIGLFYSFLALIEGLLSGIMAGMMGAMLGNMVAPADWDKTIMFIFTVALVICFLLIFEMVATVTHPNVWIKAFQNPLISSMLFLIICMSLFSQTPFISEGNPPTPPHH